MAEFDPRLLPILEAVLRSPLAPLGTSALERFEVAEGDRFRFDDDRDPLAPLPEESDTERASRQLKILDTVIGGQLRLELELLERSRWLASEFANRPNARGSGTIATLVIVPHEAESKLQEGINGEDLISVARGVQLQRTLDAWNRAIGLAGIALGQMLDR